MRPIQVAAVVLFISAGLMLFGSFSKSWLEAGGGSFRFSIGLREGEICSDGKCETMPLSKNASEKDRTMIWSGNFSFGVGLATALAAIVVGVLMFMRQTKQGAFVVLGLGIAAPIAAIVFLGSIPAAAEEIAVTKGAGCFVYFAGSATAVIAAAIALTAKLPAIVPALPAMTAGASPVPACPRCSAPTSFVDQHARYFCATCRLYV